MAFVIGTAPDALLSVEYQDTRCASKWSNSFRKIIKVKHNCKPGMYSGISVYRTAYDAKCAIDEIVEREKEISFKDVQTFGYFSIRNKLKVEHLKIYKIELTEIEYIKN